MKKLLYIFPEHTASSHTHFSYIPPFLDYVGGKVDITLIIERGEKPDLKHVRKINMCSRLSFIRSVQLVAYILRARLSGISVCYVHYSFMSAFIASLIFRTTGGRVLYWNCGLPWLYERSIVREVFEGMVYKMVTHVVTGTEKLADHYAEQYLIPRSKVLVMPNWIDVRQTRSLAETENRERAREKIGIPKNAAIILFAHRLSKRKGAHYLPDIARNLPENSYLIVLGDGPLRIDIERDIEQAGAAKTVRFFGWQPHDSVIKFMSIADVFIMPSDEEGFPHVLLEAMALGMRFVVSGVGGVPEIVPEVAQSMVIPKGDVHGFSQGITLLLGLPQPLLDVWSSETELAARRYGIERVAGRFIEIVS